MVIHVGLGACGTMRKQSYENVAFVYEKLFHPLSSILILILILVGSLNRFVSSLHSLLLHIDYHAVTSLCCSIGNAKQE